MAAVLAAAGRGQGEKVLEREARVGGQVWLGASSPLRRSMAEYYQRQVGQGVMEVRLGVEATPEALLALAPDAVVVATGGRTLRRQLPGAPRWSL